jgi:hypothetical protein
MPCERLATVADPTGQARNPSDKPDSRRSGVFGTHTFRRRGGQLRAHLTVITCEGELDLISARARETRNRAGKKSRRRASAGSEALERLNRILPCRRSGARKARTTPIRRRGRSAREPVENPETRTRLQLPIDHR